MDLTTTNNGLTRRTGVSTCVNALSRFALKIGLLCSLATTSSLAELCIYRRSIYDAYTDSYSKALTTTSCPWGCCYNHSSPCCSAPISLIVGCVLGGLLLVCLVIVAVCCCCVCRKRASRPRRATSSTGSPVGRSAASTSGETGMSVTYSTRSGDSELGYPGPVVFQSDSSRRMEYPFTSNYEPPPSYDEVMRGETNAAYKPDSS